MMRHHTMKTRTAAIENMGIGGNCMARSRVVPACLASGYNARRMVQRQPGIALPAVAHMSAE
jgi:hypothetical protein